MNSWVLSINTAIEPFGFSLIDPTKTLVTHTQAASREWTENITHNIKKTCEDHQVELSKISAITVITGPGTYTGLRVGISCAKSMADIIKCPLYGLNSFEALANQVPLHKTLFGVVIPGKRGYVSFQLFNGSTTKEACSDPVSLSFDELTQFLNQFQAPLSVFGILDPALIQNKHVQYVEQHIQTDTLAKWGLTQLQDNQESHWKQITPFYFHDPVIGQPKKKNV